MLCAECYGVDGLVQDCSNSTMLAMELLQSCTKPFIWNSSQSPKPSSPTGTNPKIYQGPDSI